MKDELVTMEGYLPLAILVVGTIVFFVHRSNKDKQVLQVVAGALFAKADLLAARGEPRNSEELREQLHALNRARAALSAKPPFAIEDAEQRALQMLASAFVLEELMIGFGSHLEAYDSLSRLAGKMEKIRNAR
ncbi:hypothetical protein LQE85_06310 [Stenotrophomonas rhizophila]|uniref:hypothetical protein n=1 Tax=Stenotrophomonas rhizophila TaxID=216778 RepID=UPI00201CBB6F|nr:hypothetical protein [Stenotrophomonas rhizophila]UQY88825.1 hypothetical protein LQE85_06310 [Stenotrophomonas rhizophila]